MFNIKCQMIFEDGKYFCQMYFTSDLRTQKLRHKVTASQLTWLESYLTRMKEEIQY